MTNRVRWFCKFFCGVLANQSETESALELFLSCQAKFPHPFFGSFSLGSHQIFHSTSLQIFLFLYAMKRRLFGEGGCEGEGRGKAAFQFLLNKF